MTHVHVNVGLLQDKLIDLLHPDQRGLMRNAQLSRHVHTLSMKPGVFQPQGIDIHDCACVLVQGVIGVKHDFEGRDSLTHFYEEGDLFLTAETSSSRGFPTALAAATRADSNFFFK